MSIHFLLYIEKYRIDYPFVFPIVTNRVQKSNHVNQYGANTKIPKLHTATQLPSVIPNNPTWMPRSARFWMATWWKVYLSLCTRAGTGGEKWVVAPVYGKRHPSEGVPTMTAYPTCRDNNLRRRVARQPCNLWPGVWRTDSMRRWRYCKFQVLRLKYEHRQRLYFLPNHCTAWLWECRRSIG